MSEESITSTGAELSVPQEPPASIVQVAENDFELSASNPAQMVQCHGHAVEWCRRKLEIVRGEAKELRESYEYAKQRKWKAEVLKRHAVLAGKRVTFYEKMLAALEAGYYIVPNFPATAFAVRRDDAPVNFVIGYGHWSNHKSQEPIMTEAAGSLPAGEGEYQNPEPVVARERTHPADAANPTGAHKISDFYAIGWQDLEFPANMARLTIMECATRAMALKVFDEIGMLPSDRKRHGDPILIGRIVLPKTRAYGEPSIVSFMLGWHIDTRLFP